MKREEASPAKRRALRRNKQGKITGSFDFNFESDQSLDEYYDLRLTEKEVSKLVGEYSELNLKFENEFLEKTKLQKEDTYFLLLAVALQVARQYLFSYWNRLEHTATKKMDKAIEKNASNRVKGLQKKEGTPGGFYYNSVDSILLKGVPYDVTASNGILNIGGKYHRYATLGHDPILGWIIGPMNIMTNTLTTNEFQSYHIRRSALENGRRIPRITMHADNAKLMHYCMERVQKEPIALASALLKQAIHFNSDAFTSVSLPLPFVETISLDSAEELNRYGIDVAGFVKAGSQAALAILINQIISIIHRMFYDEAKHGDEQLYKVRTRKILMYSNTIASTSNLIQTVMTKNLKMLDIGGLIVTVYRIVADQKFIDDMFREYVDSNVSKVYEEKLVRSTEKMNELLKEYYNPNYDL